MILQCVTPQNGDAPNWGYRIEINQETYWDQVDLQVTHSWNGSGENIEERGIHMNKLIHLI